MFAMNSKELIRKLLNSADVKINGDRPWDIQVYNDKLYDRIISKGTLGIGESYMDGWWDCKELDAMLYRVLHFSDKSIFYKNLTYLFHFLKLKFLNLQNKTKATEVAKTHYDLGNDLYMSFLDPYNQYSCGYFKNTDDLKIAQEKKLDLICKKLQLKSTDRVLDIGCGWGGFAKYAALHYGCHVTGITLSKEQVSYAKKFTEGLPVNIELLDYRDISQNFDKIVSVGMFEHVGYKNYRKMLEIVGQHLNKDGLFLLHTIGKNKSIETVDPWIEKYIFPNGILPSAKRITSSFEGLFVLEDWHNFGQYYDPTLITWYKNFDKSWPSLKQKYGDRFYRMFRYYLLSCAAGFRARELQLWQIVLSPRGVQGGYESIR
ncbi:cyclopropane-fatty-acyl-phospholipid synthase [Candidatus Nomurabacteria bacterium RIFCSPHIGHO2_01_FULL_40_12]|uniref:Cyclopropane-fatty-acyl-phospholipid synthase n=1 Tax=Candidatus Nomurabacteria bacterium RIFCSPHIGHO2_01_FULL_40_12 TaxID=1801737 RepID=A0A1F6UYI5_9BACT|nr:MAG: cyclopropane-fatty-acyl-phospholipid synthase [Candidatus Nomurabacteria bacterium RIFCSPHIGHO2_01_FULL_40_12]